MGWSANLRALLGDRGFRMLYAARLTSQAADGVFQASLVSYVLFSPERATSAGALAASLAVVVLPFSVVGPFAGIVLDRVSRQRVLVVCSLVRMLLMAILVALIAFGHTGADFYVVALASVSVNRFVLSALSAGLPVVVGLDRLVGANALSVTSGTIATLVGAGIGSGLRGLAGGDDSAVALVAGLAGLAYLLAATTAGRSSRTAFGPMVTVGWQGAWRQTGVVLADLADGARYLAGHGPARRALSALTASRAAYGLVLVMTVLLYRNHFTGDTGGLPGLAAVVAASGVGTITAAVVTPRATARMPKSSWLSLSLVFGGIVEIVFGLSFSSVPLIIAGALIGFSAQASKICVDTIVQEQTADAYRGRAFSLYDLLFNVAFVAAAAVAAILLPDDGRSPAVVVIAGAGYALSGLVYHRVTRRYPEEQVIHAVGAPPPAPAVAAVPPAQTGPQASAQTGPQTTQTGPPLAQGRIQGQA